jgi:hypothetical protein
MEERKSFMERLEDSFMAVAYAEAADYRDLVNIVRFERDSFRDFAHPDECRHGDNDMCYLES